MNPSGNDSSQQTKRPGKNGNVAPPAPKGNRYNEKHGLNALKKAWSHLDNRMIDGRSPAAVALRKWRQEIVNDLGGLDNISAQTETIIDLACRSRLILHSVDVWIFEQESLIYRSKKRLATLLPVVIQRQQLADGLAKYMSMLGLERRHKVKTLHDLLTGDAENDDKPAAVNGNGNAEAVQ